MKYSILAFIVLTIGCRQVDIKQIPVIDSHLHFFDTSRPEGVMWPPKSNKEFYKPAFPKHFKSIAKENHVHKGVVVQASNWVMDVDWNLKVTENEADFYSGVVCNLVTLGTDQFKIDIDKVIDNKRLVGMRITHPPENRPFYTNELLRDLKYIASHNMSLDILPRRFSNKDLINIAKEVPEMKIIIGLTGDNKELVQEMSKLSNVYCKYKVPMNSPKTKENFKLIWESFGADRIVFGSNWPGINKLPDGYTEKKEALYQLLKNKGKSAIEKVFYKNALSFYQLENGRQ